MKLRGERVHTDNECPVSPDKARTTAITEQEHDQPLSPTAEYDLLTQHGPATSRYAAAAQPKWTLESVKQYRHDVVLPYTTAYVETANKEGLTTLKTYAKKLLVIEMHFTK
ncbi:hypothetical protein J6590_008508 [Homalodisca vitripennis]|nr:hypothetical protein J6590_008508 [Homalodisca vitripennis]